MPNLQDIRSRIDSVKNTQKITQAMRMVSAAKLRRAQENIVNLRPYAHGLLKVIADIAVTQRVQHPLLSLDGEVKRVLVVVLTSDRGLCGGFNSSVNKFAEKFYKENKDKYKTLDFLFIGRKAKDYLVPKGVNAIDTVLNLAKEISFEMASEMADRVSDAFTNGDYDEVKIIYSEFKSAIQQDVVCETLLPVDISHSELNGEGVLFANDLIFEPQPKEIIDDLLERHFSTQMYRCMSESVASEHGARMTAMENSSKNAKEMINSMTLTYNKLRQAAITTELIEITSGAEALNG
ncbi:MAG: ATP synthase F1 subunit gamma [Bdellovibrionales bacterium]|nr:ATP synthase F1 subunit gamma [Bdellovibrionales bacterium]